MSSIPSKLLSGFRLKSELGTGATGTVQQAELLRPLGSLRPGQTVAIKFLDQNLTKNVAARKRFLHEAHAGQSIRHPNLVRVYAVEEIELLGQKFLYLVMEFLQGQTLRELLDKEAPLTESLIRNIAQQLAAGLSALHAKGLVHRDIKPENVFLTKDGRVVLMDLGFASPIQSKSESAARESFVGSLAYAAPERIRGRGRLQPSSDLYSLGILLYEIATARKPFPYEDLPALIHAQLEERPANPSDYNSRLSPFLEQLILTLLAKEPGKRIAGAKLLQNIVKEGESSRWWREIRQQQLLPPVYIRKHTIPFIGREKNMNHLQAIWQRAQKTKLQVVVIEGTDGIGKSRFVDEFAAKMQNRPQAPIYLYGRSSRIDETVPFRPWLDILRRFLGLPPKNEPGQAELRKLKSILDHQAAEHLYQTLRGTNSGKADSAEVIAESFVIFVKVLCSLRPTILFFDDFRWMGDAGLRALELLIEEKRLPLLILVALSARVDHSAIANFLEHCQRKNMLSKIALGHLSLKDIQALLASRFSPDTAIQEWARILNAHSEGNPAMLREIFEVLRSRNQIAEVDGKWRIAVSPKDTPIPNSVVEALRERRSLLEAQERAILECAAVLGARFDSETLTQAFGWEHLQVLQLLNSIEKKYGLLVSSGQEFRFSRPMVREILYQDLDPAVRVQAHAKIAHSIEKKISWKALTLRQATLLLNHASKGKLHQKALRLCLALVQWMYQRSLFEKVQQYAVLAIEHLDQLPESAKRRRQKFDLLRRSAEASGRLGARAAEKKALEECARLANSLQDENLKAETYYLLARYSHTTGKYLTALGFLERAERTFAKVKNEQGRLRSLVQKANVLSFLGDFKEAELLFHSIITQGTSANIRLLVALGLGTLNINQGLLDVGLKNLTQAYQYAKQQKDLLKKTLVDLSLGRTIALIGKTKEAIKILQEGIVTDKKAGDRRLMALLQAELGHLFSQQREKTAATNLLLAAVEGALQVEDHYTVAVTHLYYAEHLLQESSKPKEALALLRRAIEAADIAELYELHAKAQLVLAKFYLAQMQKEQAFAAAKAALHIQQTQRIAVLAKIQFYIDYSNLLHELNKQEEFQAAAHRAQRLILATCNLIHDNKLRRLWSNYALQQLYLSFATS